MRGFCMRGPSKDPGYEIIGDFCRWGFCRWGFRRPGFCQWGFYQRGFCHVGFCHGFKPIHPLCFLRDDKRWTPMMYVAYLGCACSTEVLVEYGTKVDLWDKNKVSFSEVIHKTTKSIRSFIAVCKQSLGIIASPLSFVFLFCIFRF